MRRHAWNCDLSTKPGTDILTNRHMYNTYTSRRGDPGGVTTALAVVQVLESNVLGAIAPSSFHVTIAP